MLAHFNHRSSAVAFALTAVAVSGCTRATPTSSPSAGSSLACCAAEARDIAARYRVSAITQRRFTQAELSTALEPALRSATLRATEIGRSIQGRPIRAITFGSGPTTVLLWSQMHGDESTATMSLADMLTWFSATTPSHAALRDRIAQSLTVVMVPMLNPDGAELFQRENAVGVDVNRDASKLASPEARALKALRDSIRPRFGFNLHDQGARIISGKSGKQVGIALLAPASNERNDFTGARVNARLLAAELYTLIDEVIPGRVARYDENFNPRAFGDLMQSWGTSTVLIESGALPDDPQKQKLREVNVIAILSALDAIGRERYLASNPRVYDEMQINDRTAIDVIVRGAQVVLPGAAPLRVDLALNYEDALSKLRPRVREVGDLSLVSAFDTLDASGLFLHPAPAMLTEQRGLSWMRVGAMASFTLRKSRDATSEIVRTIGNTQPESQRSTP